MGNYVNISLATLNNATLYNVTYPTLFISYAYVDTVLYIIDWGDTTPKPGEEKSIMELREKRKLEEEAGRYSTQVLSLKEKLEFTPLSRNKVGMKADCKGSSTGTGLD
uniref:Uncharacterized protein n=1 Tax=Oncorhynchus tshawytscha TaxID=74940 RepID=A0A8C8FN67_ONCTS